MFAYGYFLMRSGKRRLLRIETGDALSYVRGWRPYSIRALAIADRAVRREKRQNGLAAYLLSFLISLFRRLPLRFS